MFVAGVDGCRDGWVMVALEKGRFAGATKHTSFDQVLQSCEEATAIGVDIPIGLLDTGARSCDLLASQFVGPRHASVFATPPREAIEAPSYEEANARARVLWGKGISKQAYALRAKILEVDRAVREERVTRPPQPSAPPAGAEHQHPSQRIIDKREDRESLLRFARVIDRSHGSTTKPAVLVPELRDGKLAESSPGLASGRVIEVHPEASFREIAGEPLDYGKKSYNGMMMRMKLLAKAGIQVPAQLDGVGGVGIDDVLDAAAAAWTAHRYARGQAVSLPARRDWQHDGERIIAIWV